MTKLIAYDTTTCTALVMIHNKYHIGYWDGTDAPLIETFAYTDLSHAMLAFDIEIEWRWTCENMQVWDIEPEDDDLWLVE